MDNTPQDTYYGYEVEMNYHFMLEKTIEFLINFAVVSAGVGIYEKKLYGICVAAFAYITAMSLGAIMEKRQ